MLACLPFTGVSTLLLNFCYNKQETEECSLKFGGYIYHQGTYTPQAGNEKDAGFLPFTGVRTLRLKTCHKSKNSEEEGHYGLQGNFEKSGSRFSIQAFRPS